MSEVASAGITGDQIWVDGSFVAWPAAQVHILTHTITVGVVLDIDRARVAVIT